MGVVESSVAHLRALDDSGSEEGPGKVETRRASENRHWNRQRQQGSQPGQDFQLALHARDRDRASWKPECVALVDDPDRVIPTQRQERQPSGFQLGKLVADQAVCQGLVDLDLGRPLMHC